MCPRPCNRGMCLRRARKREHSTSSVIAPVRMAAIAPMTAVGSARLASARAHSEREIRLRDRFERSAMIVRPPSSPPSSAPARALWH